MNTDRAVMLTPAEIAACDADADLIILGKQFDAAWHKQQCIEGLATNDDAGDILLSEAVEATTIIVAQIAQFPAATMDGFRIKAKAVSWCQAGLNINLNLGPDPKPRIDVQIANSILNDLLECKNTPDRLDLLIDAANHSPLTMDQIEALTRNLDLKATATVCLNTRLLTAAIPNHTR